ncbi:hypothetical protein ABPG77_005506 [Micractinium sp. CCAP 211/92]
MQGAMKQFGRASRALSPKRRQSRLSVDGNEDSDTPGSPGGSSPSFVSLTGRTASGRARFRTRRRRSGLAAPAELPELEKSEEDFKREWGISREREEILLTEFRKIIEKEVGPLKPMFDRFYLRRFLRARQHELPRAKAMFLAHLKWRKENGIDGILEDFHFQERDAFLSIYPQGYHKTDKMGRPVYIQHIGAIKIKQLAEITTEDRMIRFHVQEYERCLKYIFPSCSKKAGRHIDQTFAIMDVKGVGLKHLTGDVKSILGRITETDQNNYPETLGKTVIINAPTVFKMIWAVVRPMLDVRTQAKIEVAPSDYMKLLLKYVDAENIPEYLGGKSKGSLIDDVGPWKDPSILALVEADIARREGLASTGEDGALTGDSMDLEGGSATGTSVPPSPLAAQRASSLAAQRQSSSGSAQQAAAGPATVQVSGQATSAESPFEKFGAGAFQPPAGLLTSDSEMEEFQDARSRRQSILSSSGSSAYLSGGDEGDEYFTPRHSELPTPVRGSGFSFHSDRPLLTASAAASPNKELAPVAGVAAQPPYAEQQQQQQGQAGGLRYSDQYPASSPQQLQDGGAIAAARRGARPQLAVVVPSPSGAGAAEQQSSSGGPEPSLNGGITSAATAFGTPGSIAWSPNKGQQQQLAGGVPSPPTQIPILARVRALEEKLPETERHIKRYLPPGSELPSKAVGQGTLLHRVQALERAMDTLLRAQDTALDAQRHRGEDRGRGCNSCCCIQ